MDRRYLDSYGLALRLDHSFVLYAHLFLHGRCMLSDLFELPRPINHVQERPQIVSVIVRVLSRKSVRQQLFVSQGRFSSSYSGTSEGLT